jgi:hypothetical protein
VAWAAGGGVPPAVAAAPDGAADGAEAVWPAVEAVAAVALVAWPAVGMLLVTIGTLLVAAPATAPPATAPPAANSGAVPGWAGGWTIAAGPETPA